MPYAAATLSANAGVALSFHGARFWIDALHNEKVPSFSVIPPEVLERLWEHPAFQSPDALIYTHCHPDHFSAELTLQALARWPETELILPERQFPEQVLLEGDVVRHRIGPVELTFWKLFHEEEKYHAVPHYTVLLSDGERNILFSGDCEIANPLLEERLQGITLDAAFVDFPWVAKPRGRAFLREKLRPRTLVVDHLPFAWEDPFHYRKATHRAAQWLSDTMEVRFLEEPLQTVEL